MRDIFIYGKVRVECESLRGSKDIYGKKAKNVRKCKRNRYEEGVGCGLGEIREMRRARGREEREEVAVVMNVLVRVCESN